MCAKLDHSLLHTLSFASLKLWPTYISASFIIELQAVQQINAITSFLFVLWKLKQCTVHTTRGACYVRLVGNKPLFFAHSLLFYFLPVADEQAGEKFEKKHPKEKFGDALREVRCVR